MLQLTNFTKRRGLEGLPNHFYVENSEIQYNYVFWPSYVLTYSSTTSSPIRKWLQVFFSPFLGLYGPIVVQSWILDGVGKNRVAWPSLVLSL